MLEIIIIKNIGMTLELILSTIIKSLKQIILAKLKARKEIHGINLVAAITFTELKMKSIGMLLAKNLMQMFFYLSL